MPILARFTDYTVVGCPPEIMGIGPAVAIPKLLERNNLKIDDIDIFELNEAFASQATYCVEKLKIPPNKLNPKGGAIALGHPLGCTGKVLFKHRFSSNSNSFAINEKNWRKESNSFNVYWFRYGSSCLNLKIMISMSLNT